MTPLLPVSVSIIKATLVKLELIANITLQSLISPPLYVYYRRLKVSTKNNFIYVFITKRQTAKCDYQLPNFHYWKSKKPFSDKSGLHIFFTSHMVWASIKK